MTAKLVYTGTTHTTGGSDGAARSTDGILDIKLPEPHPTAEVLFAAAWSACFIGAIGVAAGQRKIALTTTPAIDATIDLLRDGSEFFLRARLDISIPGVDRDTAQTLIDAAHAICPYSKATSGNIEVELNLI